MPNLCPDCSGPLVEVRQSCGPVWYCPRLIGVLQYSRKWQQHYRPEGDEHRPSAVLGYKLDEVVPYGATRRVA